MRISHVVQSIQEDLLALAELGGAEQAEFVGRLTQAAGPAIRSRILEAIDVLAADVNAAASQRVFAVQLAGDDVAFEVVDAARDEEPSESTGDFNARFALRLPEDLKSKVEHLAQQSGNSINTWIVRALGRETNESETRHTVRSAHQLKGTGRS